MEILPKFQARNIIGKLVTEATIARTPTVLFFTCDCTSCREVLLRLTDLYNKEVFPEKLGGRSLFCIYQGSVEGAKKFYVRHELAKKKIGLIVDEELAVSEVCKVKACPEILMSDKRQQIVARINLKNTNSTSGNNLIVDEMIKHLNKPR